MIQFDKIGVQSIREMTPYQPGKPVEELERELGIGSAIKLASNENPFGCSGMVKNKCLAEMDKLAFYPDGNAYYLKNALSEFYSLATDQITIGNGSNDILDLLARSFLAAGDEVIFSKYAFLVYPLVAKAVSAVSVVANSLPADHASQPFGHDLSAFYEAISDKTKLIFIANPNNPTGTWVSYQLLENFVKKVPSNIIVVIDEAYFEYVVEPEYQSAIQLIADFPNVVVTRTFSKIYGLAGLRIGYSISHSSIADLLNRVRQPFNSNSIGLAAAQTALTDQKFVEACKERNNNGMQQLREYFDSFSINYIPSVANFIAVEFKERALGIYQQLLQRGIIVRPIANYQLDDFLRITVGSEQQNNRLIDALKEIL